MGYVFSVEKTQTVVKIVPNGGLSKRELLIGLSRDGVGRVVCESTDDFLANIDDLEIQHVTSTANRLLSRFKEELPSPLRKKTLGLNLNTSTGKDIVRIIVEDSDIPNILNAKTYIRIQYKGKKDELVVMTRAITKISIDDTAGSQFAENENVVEKLIIA